MKGFTKTLTALAALLALGGGARAQDGDHDGCSDTTLRGDYGFTISGQITGGPSPGPVNGVALTTFDGQGGLTQTDFVVKSGAPAEPLDAFRTGELWYVLGELGLHWYDHHSFS